MNTVTHQLQQRYGISAKPGEKVKCPFCGRKTFSIKSDDSLGKCFHPNCGRRIGKNTSATSALSSILADVLQDAHRELMVHDEDLSKTAFDYLTTCRQIHPKVINAADIGVVPVDYDCTAKISATWDEVKRARSKTKPKSTKKRSKNQSTDENKEIEWFREQSNKLKKYIRWYEGWLCFFYSDAHGSFVAIRFREPYEKKIRYFKPVDTAGLFGFWDTNATGLNSAQTPSELIICEGEFNTLQFCSLLVRADQLPASRLLPYDVCSVGGVTNADYKTIKAINNSPIIVYDNDASEAGFQLVAKARNYMTVSAVTTPEVGSDMDEYICGFGTQNKAAYEAVTYLLQQRVKYPRYYKPVADEIHVVRVNKDPDGNSLHPAFVVNQIVAAILIRDLRERGTFHHDDFASYHFRDEDKLLIALNAENNDFILLLSNYDLNPTEAIYKYVVDAIKVDALKNGQRTVVYRFAHYDQIDNILYWFNGDSQVYRITSKAIDLADNGTDGVLFLKERNASPFEIGRHDADRSDLRDQMLSPIHFATNILTPSESQILLTLWFYALFFASIMKTKPILALIGPKGSGKTSALVRFGILLFGEHFNVTPLSDDEKDFDAAVTNQHLVAIDNADSVVKWFNNRLATSATGGTIKKRELYTTNKLVEFAIRSFIAITARTPKFRRDDVADRLLIVRLDRIDEFVSENILQRNIILDRDAVLTEVAYHLQLIVGALEMYGEEENVGSFRMADFASFSIRIGKYAERESTIEQILEKLSRAQSEFSIEDDTTVDLLMSFARQNPGKEVTSTELHRDLVEQAEKDQIEFFYAENVRGFHQHLSNISTSLGEHLHVSIRAIGSRKRLYSFRLKAAEENND